jgi:hypothetical protein
MDLVVRLQMKTVYNPPALIFITLIYILYLPASVVEVEISPPRKGKKQQQQEAQRVKQLQFIERQKSTATIERLKKSNLHQAAQVRTA